MEREPIRNDARRVRRVRRLGKGAICGRCGERDARALVVGTNPILCYQCLAAARGRPAMEEHHLAGRRNSTFTVMVPGNDHRVLNEMQKRWPRKTLRNPHRSQLLQAAATLRGSLDLLQLVLERGLAEIPDSLEDLDAWLEERLGPEWWRHMPRR